MDIVALEFICAVSVAREQIEIGTDLVEMEEALQNLKFVAPDHELLPVLETTIVHRRTGSVLVQEARRLRQCARKWDLD